MQRLIISRKGLDTGNDGGRARSAILEDGTLCSLPIPNGGNDRRKARVAGGLNPLTYGDLRHSDIDTGKLIDGLTGGRLNADSGVHLDPDIRRNAYRRERGWRALFGQAGNAQQHLAKEEVGLGDLFLFFGIFQRVKETDTGYRYDSNEPPLHVLWGWLQVGEMHKPSLGDTVGKWAQYHDHVKYADGYAEDKKANNTLYVASKQLDLGYGLTVPSAGVFPSLHDDITLTKPGQDAVSHWRLPRWFYPFFSGRERKPLTHFPYQNHWKYDKSFAYATRSSYGQEFVLHLDQYPEARKWLRGLFRNHAT